MPLQIPGGYFDPFVPEEVANRPDGQHLGPEDNMRFVIQSMANEVNRLRGDDHVAQV